MTVNNGMFSSNNETWGTPQWLFDELNDEFSFTLDVCATPKNAKCKNYVTPEQDTLATQWGEYRRCWMNPPYGRKIGHFIAKAHAERTHGNITVMLLPARTDTKWFHSYIWDKQTNRPRTGVDVRLLEGRLKFEDAAGKPMGPAPFPSMIVVFYPAY